MAEEQSVQKVMVAGKSMAMAIVLAIIFGPLGMLYATVTGGIVMIFISILAAVFTLGFGLFLTWPVCVVWAAIATNSYNKKIMA
jgi:hypothetical protein